MELVITTPTAPRFHHTGPPKIAFAEKHRCCRPCEPESFPARSRKSLPALSRLAARRGFALNDLGVAEGEGWCCQTGLNCRPLHYQWSALPLSYGSMPGSGESAKTAPTGGPILATRPRPAQARERPAGRRKIGKISAVGPPPSLVRPVLGRSGSRIRRRACRAPGFRPSRVPVIFSSGATHESGSTMTDDRDKGEGRAGRLAKKRCKAGPAEGGVA